MYGLKKRVLTILADNVEFPVQTFLFERTTGSLRGLTVCTVVFTLKAQQTTITVREQTGGEVNRRLGFTMLRSFARVMSLVSGKLSGLVSGKFSGQPFPFEFVKPNVKPNVKPKSAK